jgi:hypothetical protein
MQPLAQSHHHDWIHDQQLTREEFDVEEVWTELVGWERNGVGTHSNHRFEDVGVAQVA